ncbi:hypothetical protein [Salinibaculum marinum]|uniref:hypothetical protein n=1 Tax=Salinibaculum marinum TaxID=3131993 RepID=UPI0030CC53EC
MSVEQRSGFRVLAPVLVSLWLLGTVVSYWLTGINWSNRGSAIWVGIVVAVTIGMSVWTLGILTGGYARRRQLYIRAMQACGAVALAGAVSLLVL